MKFRMQLKAESCCYDKGKERSVSKVWHAVRERVPRTKIATGTDTLVLSRWTEYQI
jgi:hypothetical protein